MAPASKAKVTLGGVPLAGVGAVAWKFQTGTRPYTAIFQVYTEVWDQSLKGRVMQPLNLQVHDARGVVVTVQKLLILHAVPSDSPHRTSFVVADMRWNWQYTMVARDYNMTKKTGDRQIKNPEVPVENQVVADKYDYKPYSLNKGVRWTAKDAVEDILAQLEASDGGSKFQIESFPIEGDGIDGQFSLQNIVIRDQGDVALARLLSYIPGAEVYMDIDGIARVFDGTDLTAAEQHFDKLPPPTWDGEKAEFINRKYIRPSEVRVFYQREVEVAFEFADNYGGTTAIALDPNRPFLENVLPTVDPTTEVTLPDPISGKPRPRTVPAGTWVEVSAWLDAMDLAKPDNSLPWTFDTIKYYWIKPGLEPVMGVRGADLGEEYDVPIASRLQALKQHWRQTFRINRRYMERVRDIQAIRVATLDPVTGQRALAAVWGQACLIPSTKGNLTAARNEEVEEDIYRNIDNLPVGVGEDLVSNPPSPAQITMIDRDLGIFHVDWKTSPYGTVDTIVPCHTVGEGNAQKPAVPNRNLAKQDDSFHPGMKIDGGANSLLLRDTMKLKAMLTIMPAAPNNKSQFHTETVTASEIAEVFRTEFRIQDGEGPALEVYVPPGEATARFAWEDDTLAASTVARLLGLFSDDPNDAGLEDNPATKGIDESQMLGFKLINTQRELPGHSKAVAAELLAAFADNLQGRVATVLPQQDIKLKGNMTGVTLQIAAAPSAKVNAVHEFPGQQKPISSQAMLPEMTRQMLLGILPFGQGDK